MRTLILTLALSVLSTSSIAEAMWASKPIQCDTVSGIVKIMKKYEEIPLFGGIGSTVNNQGAQYDTPVITFHNAITGTWTVVEFNLPGDQACVLNSGDAPRYDFSDIDFLQDLFGKPT